MPRTNSTLTLPQRREEAFALFVKGTDDRTMARKLGVGVDTIQRYRAEYEANLSRLAMERPDLLTEVVKNTLAALSEVDLVRAHAWEDYERAKDGTVIECEGCGSEIRVQPSPTQTQAVFLRTILSAQDQKSKLYGLFGVKAEYFQEVGRIKALQDKILEFMRRELCPTDRNKMIAFLGDEGAARTSAVDLVELSGPTV